MILFLKKLFNTKSFKYLRNTFQYRVIPIDFSNLSYSTSISDGFIWRTDNDFKTIFRYSDLLKFFYEKDDSGVEMKFYDQNYNLIKEMYVDKLDFNNELIIDKKFMNGKDGYGIFYIFHKYKGKLDNNIILSNRCYLGFSKSQNHASFVHGNSHLISKSFLGDLYDTNFVSKSRFSNSIYKIQNNFEEFDESELFFCNPNDSELIFYVNDKQYKLEGFNSKIVEIKNKKMVKIKSNCNFLRPIVFNYKNNFFDVYHS
jgi:hypothetical protein